MHNGMITLDRRKMAKSEGNVLDPMALIERHGSRVTRFALLNAHYASPIDFAEERLVEARSALERFATFALAAGDETGVLPDAPLVEAFRAALAEDFNLAAAFSVLFEAVRAANRGERPNRPGVLAAIRACGAMIGLDLLPAPERDAVIERLIEERARARAARDFAAADAIRKDLSARGVIIEDTPKGTIWRR
jgi:cysteinyl-tRNA synthetase